MDDKDLRILISEEMSRVERHVLSQIELQNEKVKTHLTDRFAHGWDHDQLTKWDSNIKDWQTWRDGVNKFRWMITGALVFVAAEIPTATAIVGYIYAKH